MSNRISHRSIPSAMLADQNAAGNLEGFFERDPVLLIDGEGVFFFDHFYGGNEAHFVLYGYGLYVNCVAICRHHSLQPSKIRLFIDAFEVVPKLIPLSEIIFADGCPDVKDQMLMMLQDGDSESAPVKEMLLVHHA